MELRTDDLQNVAFDKAYYKQKEKIQHHIEKHKLEILRSQESEKLKVEQEDLMFFSFYGLGGIFMILTMFTLYQFVSQKIYQDLIHSTFLLLVLMLASLFIGFVLAKLVIKLSRMTWKIHHRHMMRKYHELPEKITSIEVEHYDYVQITRPEGMSDTQFLKLSELQAGMKQQG